MIPLRKLGTQGLQVPALGLGCSRLHQSVPEEDGIGLVKHAFEKGVTFFDTADIYGQFTNEILVGKALKHLPRDKVQLATKFGYSWENGELVVRGNPEYVRKSCEASLSRLGVDYIDIYFQHRVDKSIPIEETMGELRKLVQEGKVKYIGLSEASVDTIRRAHAIHPVSVVQIEWSLWTRDAEQEIIPACRELGIGFMAYSPLGRGFFSGKGNLEEIQAWLLRFPRFSKENLEKNKVIFERVANLAKKHCCTTGQLALAWVLHQGDDVVPIAGTTKMVNFNENLGSLNVNLSEQDLQEIAQAVPESEVAGERYPVTTYGHTWKFADTPINNQ
eukprot:c22271_g1_i1 orf=87-1082(+)